MKDTDHAEYDKYRAPALSKGLDILELLASETDGKSQIEIAKQLGRTSSEIFRMLMVLRSRGYLALGEDGDRYFLTPKLFEVAHRHPPLRRLTAVAGEAMQRLANKINQSAHMGILHSGRVLMVAQVDCQDNNITSVRLGAHIPLFETASGRVLAAWMDPEPLETLLDQVEDKTEARRQAFVQDLPGVRAAGFCEAPSLTILGVTNISAPVFDIWGHVVAAITLPFVRRLSGTSAASVEECRKALLATCAAVSRQLGAGARD
jgi:DNA-binding IclR family transcriptional regulator